MGKKSPFKVIWYEWGKYPRIKSFQHLDKAQAFVNEVPNERTLYVNATHAVAMVDG